MPASRLIILLDHNYTLVRNSQTKRRPFTRQIEIEQYRPELVALCRDHHVILITARPDKYREATLASIEAKTGWRPQAAYFNPARRRPAQHKAQVVEELLRAGVLTMEEIRAGRVVAIESNPATRRAYTRFGIPCLNVSEDKAGNPA